MIGTLWQPEWWLVNVGPNIVASVLCFTAGVVAGWKRYGPAIREHVRKVHELHAELIARHRED
ncbi:MAG TPA: hypothetical protein VN803_08485 [Gemmatimonadales bacterium]|nr:hypothetical protein [Gemmatimonadales bacterium]